MLIGIIVGILLWNLITLTTYIVSGEWDSLTVKVGCGVLFYIALAFCWVVRRVKRYTRKRKRIL